VTDVFNLRTFIAGLKTKEGPTMFTLKHALELAFGYFAVNILLGITYNYYIHISPFAEDCGMTRTMRSRAFLRIFLLGLGLMVYFSAFFLVAKCRGRLNAVCADIRDGKKGYGLL
jgi:hypothetical protein